MKISNVGGRSPKRWNNEVRIISRGNWAQSSQDNPIREIKEDSSPKEPKEHILLKRLETKHQGHNVGRGR